MAYPELSIKSVFKWLQLKKLESGLQPAEDDNTTGATSIDIIKYACAETDQWLQSSFRRGYFGGKRCHWPPVWHMFARFMTVHL